MHEIPRGRHHFFLDLTRGLFKEGTKMPAQLHEQEINQGILPSYCGPLFRKCVFLMGNVRERMN